MKKQLVVRKPKKMLVIRKPKLIVQAICGSFKGKKVQLLKRGFSGWMGKLVDTGEPVYLWPEEVS